MPPHDSAAPEPSPAERLELLLAANQAIPFDQDATDKEYPYIRLSIWGSIPTNELFIKITNGSVSFVDVVKSPLLSPPMADRIFGMDVLDSHVAYSFADKLWEAHKSQLIIIGH